MERKVLAEAVRNGTSVRVVLGDLTRERVAAIVNAANSELWHGGGLAGAIVRRGGPAIQEESRKLAPVPVGSAASTGAGRLPAKWVIHAVGPRWGEGEEERKLRSAVRAALVEARRLGARSVGMPAISTGIFGYPKEEGCRVIVAEALAWLDANPGVLEELHFVALDRTTAELFVKALIG